MTTEEQQQQKLFTGFREAGAAAWEQKAREDLRDTPLESLTWHTYEGIDIKPYYTAEDIAGLPFAHQKPGDFPFVRGVKTGVNDWLNIQQVQVEGNGRAAIDKAADALQRGADGIFFKLQNPADFDVDYLISSIPVSKHSISYIVQEQPKGFLKRLYTSLEARQMSHRNLKGFVLYYDPMTAKGALTTEERACTASMLDLTKDSPDFYGVTVDGTNFSSIGASVTQEIAYTLSAAVAYIDRLTKTGEQLESVLRNLQFYMGSGTNYFFEIVKLRTVRLLWAAIAEAYGEPALAAKLRIHSTTSSWYQTTLDPYMNMLRATTEAMAAIIAGCDSLTVLPFDDTFRKPTEFSARIARNISIILKEEAYLDKAIDPAAGSYYLESLTHQLANSAWELFKEVEALGGFEAAYANGQILGTITEVSRRKFRNIATGRDVLVGTNKFPDPQEKIDFDPEELIQSADFDTTRAAYPTEVMRMATELHLRKRRRRPKAVVAIVGEAIKRHVNATFAQEFFSCVGFETEVTHFDTVEKASDQLDRAGAEVIVVSASEAAFVNEFAPRLRNHHAKPTIILAADPAHMKEEMVANGYDEFIFEGCDMSTIMELVNKRLHGAAGDTDS